MSPEDMSWIHMHYIHEEESSDSHGKFFNTQPDDQDGHL